MTLTADPRDHPATTPVGGPHTRLAQRRPSAEPKHDDGNTQHIPDQEVAAGAGGPVEFWPTSAVRAALEDGDLTVWQRIATAMKRDPFGRTARQVEEVLLRAKPYGVSKALTEVLSRSRDELRALESAEVARNVQMLFDRSGLGNQEFASRIGVSNDEFATYLSGEGDPPASLMIRMCRLSDRFAKMKAARAPFPD